MSVLLWYWLFPVQAIEWRYFVSEKPQNIARVAVPSIPLKYSFSEPVQTTPVLPFIPWGLRFDEDLMIALRDPKWGMIEVAKVEHPHGDLWFTLDSRQDGRQLVGGEANEELREMIQYFPARWKENDLQVIEQRDTPQVGWTTYTVSYQRDEDTISFDLWAPDSDVVPKRRNGNAMNHSQGTALALLDIYSLSLKNTRVQWRGEKQSVQKIAGWPMQARMRQAVGGIQAGVWRQEEQGLWRLGQFSSWKMSSSDERFIFRTQNQYPSVAAQYISLGSELRLEKMWIEQPHVTREDVVFEMVFSPALPDFRYGAPIDDFYSEASLHVNGQPLYALADVLITGNATEVNVGLLPKTPDWAVERPVYSMLNYTDQAVEMHTWILSPGEIQSHLVQIDEIHTIDSVLSSISFVWQKNPHRISKIAFQGASDSAVLEGGSWANGERAFDQIDQHHRIAKPPAAELYQVTTPTLALIPDIEDQNVAKLRAVIQIPFVLASNQRAVPFLNGIELESGPLHQGVGATLSRLSISIDDVQYQNDNLLVTIAVEKGVGAVPDRIQDLSRYSALASLNIGIAVFPETTNIEQQRLSVTRKIPRLSKWDRRSLGECQARSIPVGLLQSWSLDILDDGKYSGRYIRGMSISAENSLELDALEMTAKWPRETTYQITKNIVIGRDWQTSGVCSLTTTRE